MVTSFDQSCKSNSSVPAPSSPTARLVYDWASGEFIEYQLPTPTTKREREPEPEACKDLSPPPLVAGADPVSPEALFSASFKATLAGREVQLTVRGMDFVSFGKRLDQVLSLVAPVKDELPAAPEPAAEVTTPVCAVHGKMVPSKKAAGHFYCPHQLPDGAWCKSRWPTTKGQASAN